MTTCNPIQKMNKEEVVIQELKEVFGNIVNLDIIRTVAKACEFDINVSSNQLIEIINKKETNLLLSPTMNHFHVVHNSPLSEAKGSKRLTNIENAIKKINSGHKILILLRGLPGSGKSTLAKYLLENTIGWDSNAVQNHILSTDDYFMINGLYQYDSTKLSEAHGWNHQRAFSVMSRGFSPVIIDNTNVQMWEMKPYAMMATDYGYILEILEPDTHWRFNDKELAKRNKHNVSRNHIKSMIERYDKNVTPMKLLTAYDCKYKLQRPPQLRLYPPINSEPLNLHNPKPCNSRINEKFLPVNDNSKQEINNLMDFTELKASNSSAKQNKNYLCDSSSSVSVDSLLMHEDDCFVKTNILKPEIKQNNSLFDNIKTWGVDEKALRSWDIVTPLNEHHSIPIETSSGITIDTDEVVQIKETSTNTDDEDFYVLRNASFYSSDYNIKILQTYNRDINRNIPCKPHGITKKLMLDKSCLTEDIFENQNVHVHIEQLTNLFPDVPLKNIEYWYAKCNRDVEWTIELLLAEKEEVINVPVDDDTSEGKQNQEIYQEDPLGPIVIDSDSGSSSDATSGTPKIAKNKYKNITSAESLNLKKCIESKIIIGEAHYSEKLLKIKQQRYGERHSDHTLNYKNEPQPCTSTASVPKPEDFFEEMDDCEEPFEFIEMDCELRSKQGQDDCLETVEVNLGENFVKQLEENFGDPNLLYPKGFQPVVQLPVVLAKQLYLFYIESVYQQMDAQNNIMETLIKEDEEFARKLQEQEEIAAKTSPQVENTQPVPLIPQIIKEQKELSKWQKEADKWKDLTPDTIAAKLTRSKLFKAFPSVDEDTLVEILQAHDNVYTDTVETLLASTVGDHVCGDIGRIKEPPVNPPLIAEMWGYYEKCKQSEEDGPCSARDYRGEAQKYLKKRSELYEKAQKYYQSGMYEVAQFYSSLALQQTTFYERANSLAATAFVDEHFQRLQQYNTLDLHFLYVKEAINQLDIYLDRNINLLRHSPSKNKELLQVITGRGKNSQQGIAKIRPAVEARLRDRLIVYQQLNPGMLKVKITKNSKVTSEL